MEHTSINLLEKSYLSCLTIKPSLIESIVISEEFLQDNMNKLAFRFFIECYQKYKTIDYTLIVNDKQKELSTNQLNEFLEYAVSLQSIEPSAEVFSHYQDKLIEENKKRLMIKEIESYQLLKIDENTLIEKLNDIQSTNIKQDKQRLSSDYIYNEIRREDKQIHLRFANLSKTIKLSEHDFLILASRPGAGKTGFALNLLEDISDSYNCIYFNMEMSEQQILRRLVGINSAIPIKFLNNPASDHQNNKIKESTENLSKKKLNVITGSQTINMIKAKIIKESKNEHLVVFIDYVGLIHSKEKNQSIYERVTAIAKELRMISMTYNCTIIAIAQINRSGDNKPPILSELKDSGELEQSAVSVILLHNENYYKKVEKNVEELECIVAKNRNGRTGIVKMEYDQFNQRVDEPKNNWR